MADSAPTQAMEAMEGMADLMAEAVDTATSGANKL
jgi:hypothetical protein